MEKDAGAIPIEEINLLGRYHRLLGRWIWVLLAGAIGGVLGIGLARLSPPAYVAQATVEVSIDYGRTAFLDEDAEQLTFAQVQDLILADDTLASVVERMPAGLRAQAGVESVSQLKRALSLTRVHSRWNLSVTHRNPEVSAALADLWAETAMDAIQTARDYAFRAAELQRGFFHVACRPGVEVDPGLEGFWVCDEYHTPEAPGTLPPDLSEAIDLSRGIIPGMSVHLKSAAQVPTQPVTTPRAVLALTGALLGLTAGAGAAGWAPARTLGGQAQ